MSRITWTVGRVIIRLWQCRRPIMCWNGLFRDISRRIQAASWPTRGDEDAGHSVASRRPGERSRGNGGAVAFKPPMGYGMADVASPGKCLDNDR